MKEIMPSEINIFDIIKNTILKHYPYVENRISLLEDNQSPELEIIIKFINNKTYISYLHGTKTAKTHLNESTQYSEKLSLADLKQLIDFILSSHEVIRSAYLNDDSISLEFVINFKEESLKGILCYAITLHLDFSKDRSLMKDYLKFILENYYEYLNNISPFSDMKKKYISYIKKSYIKSLDKETILAYLNLLDIEKLRQLLSNIEDDDFINFMSYREPLSIPKKRLKDKKEEK